MKIVRAKSAERRKDKRYGKYGITLELDGQFYSTKDWSLGGFGVDGYQGTLELSNLVPVTIVLETGDQTYGQTAIASIVRNADAEEKLAAKFSDLGNTPWKCWTAGKSADCKKLKYNNPLSQPEFISIRIKISANC